MIVKKSNVNLLVGCLVVSMVGMTGCRTAGFSKPSLSKLAFWKKDSVVSNDMPPPPARHFDPAPLDEQVAKSGFEGGETFELNSQRFNDSLANKTSSIKDDISAAANGLTQPIRKPYSVDLPTELPDVSSKFAGTSDKLDNAQQDFKAAMNNAGDSFKPNLPKTSVSSGWKDDFSFPKSLSSSNPASSFKGKDPVYDANGKLVSSAQEARNSVTSKLNQINNSFSNKVNTVADSSNQFASNALSKAPSANGNTNPLSQFTAPKPFKTPSSFTPPADFAANSQFKAPASFQPPANTTAQNTFAATNVVAPQTNFTPPPTGFTASNGFSPPKNFTPMATNSTSVSPLENNQLATVQTQVAEAKRQIDALKSQVAAAQQAAEIQNLKAQLAAVQQQGFARSKPAPSAFAPPQTQLPTPPPQRVAQLQTPRFSPANRQPVSNQVATNSYPAGGSDFAPTNILRNSQPTLRQTSPTQQDMLAPQTQQQTSPGYPATKHGGFSSQNNLGQNFAPTGVAPQTQTQQQFNAPAIPAPSARVAAAVDFQTPDNSMILKASTSGMPKTESGVARIKNHIADVNIPDSVLSGSGSYAPGSVHAVSK